MSLHSQPTPPQDAGKGPEAVRFILVCEPTGTFFFKQTETCYLPSCDFRHLKPPSDPQLVVFPPAVLQVFPKKIRQNLSFFLFCLYSLKKCERAVDKSPQ